MLLLDVLVMAPRASVVGPVVLDDQARSLVQQVRDAEQAPIAIMDRAVDM